MKLFLIGGMEDLNFNYCYKITYESGETYDRRRNELSVEISKEDYKKIITGVLQERPIDQIEGILNITVRQVLPQLSVIIVISHVPQLCFKQLPATSSIHCTFYHF